MNKQKQSGGWLLLILGILFVVGGFYVLITNSDQIFGSKVSNINTLLSQGNLDAKVGDYVEVNIDAVIGKFAETKHTVNFIPVGKDSHYITWLDDESMIVVSASGKKAKEMDRIEDETWSYINGLSSGLTKDTLHIRGKLEKLESEINKYYREALDDLDITSEDFEIHYLAIDSTQSQLLLIIETLVLLGLGAVMLAGFIANRKAIRQAKYAAENVLDTGASFPAEYSTFSANQTLDELSESYENTSWDPEAAADETAKKYEE